MKRNAFTLIELLVVIGIIGLLVAVAIPNFLSARQRASDSKKKSEMASLKNALRLYYNDFNAYPADFNSFPGKLHYIKGCGLGGTAECPCSTSADFASSSTVATPCDTVYMKKFPSTLGTGGLGLSYYQSNSGNDFCLTTKLDNLSDPDIVSPNVSSLRCSSACPSGACSGAQCYFVCAD